MKFIVISYVLILKILTIGSSEDSNETLFCENGGLYCNSSEINFDDNVTELTDTEDEVTSEENRDVTSQIITQSTKTTTEGLTTTTEAVTTSTTEVISTSTTEAIPTTTHSNIIEYKIPEDICSCDLTVKFCDINCCCDLDCTNHDKQSFSHCHETVMNYDSKLCHQTNFVYRNRTKFKMIKNNQGLFCLVHDNLPGRLMYKNRKIIQTMNEFKDLIKKKHVSGFVYSEDVQPNYSALVYQSGSLVWTVDKDQLIPFGIPEKSLTSKCLSNSFVKYLFNTDSSCGIFMSKSTCESNPNLNMKYYVADSKRVISSPVLFNETVHLPIKNCPDKVCMKITPYICSKYSTSDCKQQMILPSFNSSDQQCQNIVKSIEYIISQNSTNGITKVDAYFVLTNLSLAGVEDVVEMVQNFKVGFKWNGFNKTMFSRSGNPGYLIGYPVLAGKKIYLQANNTVGKEAIELSTDSKDWLTVFGSDNGFCKSKPRKPVLFKENAIHTCSLSITPENFTKDGCVTLQNTIFDLLLGQEIENISASNYFNKFVATYGNSKPEETGDWVRVLVDTFPLISSRVVFKTDSMNKACKNVVTNVKVDVITSNVGSLADPQAKILGVSMILGPTDDISVNCYQDNCINDEVNVILYTTVNFIDITEPAVVKFAETPGLDISLPHDFFYPFFSAGVQIKFDLTLISLIYFLF